MILEKIRTVFPNINRIQEQDLLIGSTCLALTDQERDTIENFNFNRYESNLDKDKRKELSLKEAESVANAQMWGVASGFAIGGVSSGAAAWYWADLTTTEISSEVETWYWSALPPLAAVVSGITGGYLGSIAGKKLGGNIGYERAIKNVTNTPEFVRWKNEKYVTVILPALSRYVDPDQESGKNSFDELVNNYNSKVLAQQSIFDLAKEHFEPLIEQEKKIVRFYSMTQRERIRIKNAIETELLNIKNISDAELEEVDEFLTAAAKLPRLLMTTR